MIIPIRCFTCGKLVGNLWKVYQSTLQEEIDKHDIEYVIPEKEMKTIENNILDKLQLKRYCCRRMLTSNVDLCSKI